jgi:hypothetical protein
MLCTQVERYGPYTAVYGYFTTYKRTVYDRNIGHRNTPYHNEITTLFDAVTVKISIAVSIDLGNYILVQ